MGISMGEDACRMLDEMRGDEPPGQWLERVVVRIYKRRMKK